MPKVNVQHICQTEADAIKWRDEYERAYDWLAYSTSLTIKQIPDGGWSVTGHRYDTAD